MEMLRRDLGRISAPTDVLRTLRDEPGLCALIGDWYDGGAIVAFSPLRVASPDDDPFDSVVGTETEHDGVFGGGWIGYWGYQVGADIERLPSPPPRPSPLPSFRLAYYDHVLRMDRGTERWWFEALVTDERRDFVERQYARIVDLLSAGGEDRRGHACSPFAMIPEPTAHREVVASALRHIGAGDIFQANMCVRLEAEFDGDPLDAFCAGVEALTPRYAAFVRTPGGAVASLSPELFLRRKGRDVLTSPIKGTAPLTADVRTLAASWKNRAENIMIVDLMRNDLGRVCEPGSIWVPSEPRAEPHTGVWHLVSDVSGRLPDDADDADLLRATFPPGSVTGAPKVRAMELINEHEATAREVYTGAVGYVSPCAGLEANVAIRTFEFAGGRVWLGVGGGIVADSDPGDEIRECLVKARPLIDAIGGRIDEGVVDAVGSTPPPVDAEAAFAPPRSVDAVEPDLEAGVFETMLVEGGRVRHLDDHLERLSASLEALYAARRPDGLAERIRTHAAELDGPHRLRVTVNGVSHEQIEAFAVSSSPAAPWRLEPRAVPGGLGPHKWRDRSMLDAIAPTGDADTNADTLIVDTDGSVLETGRGTVFVVDDHGVHTPELDGRILPGVTRRHVLATLSASGVPSYERRIGLDELTTAHEVFTANAVRLVSPVVACDGVGNWEPGPTTDWLRTTLVSPPGPPPPRAAAPIRRVLLIDNYDSFVYNLDQYARELGASTEVVRNDAVTVADVEAWIDNGAFDRVIVSPGPGTPADAGISNGVIARVGDRVPILGVCLGHQCIGEVYGASVVRAPSVVHGKSSLVHHGGVGVFAGVDGPLASGRYHSLVVDESSLLAELAPTAHTASGVLMGLRHRRLRVEGVQLHPESILTRHGHHMLANFFAQI